ncbi:MAG: hypothetical protein M1823_004208 [Watsoniomyces obsoletus]|nr:MAG: hypothetical protein M1823_004208 [Watsoniomyces obsoletus]
MSNHTLKFSPLSYGLLRSRQQAQQILSSYQRTGHYWEPCEQMPPGYIDYGAVFGFFAISTLPRPWNNRHWQLVEAKDGFEQSQEINGTLCKQEMYDRQTNYGVVAFYSKNLVETKDFSVFKEHVPKAFHIYHRHHRDWTQQLDEELFSRESRQMLQWVREDAGAAPAQNQQGSDLVGELQNMFEDSFNLGGGNEASVDRQIS